MARCPKCDYKLKVTDISQFCPKCGVNMRFYNFDKNFIYEAKVAELSQATVHVKIKRLKAAFIGNKLCIARLVAVLLPVLGLLVPAGSFSMSMPFVESVNVSLGALGIYSMFTDGTFNYLNSMCASELLGTQFSAIRMALFVYLAAAFFAVAVLIATILCFISYKNMQKVIAGISFGGAAVSVAGGIVSAVTAGKLAGSDVFTASAGFGSWVLALMFVAVAAVNLILVKKGIPVEYAEGMLERLEIWHKVKAGEVKIDDLPQPVVETAETRKIDEEIAKEEETYRRRAEEKAAEEKEKGEGES